MCVKLILKPAISVLSLALDHKKVHRHKTKAWENVQYMCDLQRSPQCVSGILVMKQNPLPDSFPVDL